MIWTEKYIAIVREYAATGYSSGKIAEELNVSRNAVIGVCGRNGIKLIRKKSAYINSKRPHRRVRDHTGEKRIIVRRKIRADITPYAPTVKRSYNTNQFVPLINAEPWHCRYPIDGVGRVGNPHICGKDANRGSYCDDHARICYLNNHHQKYR